MIEQLAFVFILAFAVFTFGKKIAEVRRNINLGKAEKLNDEPARRWKNMAKVALGQSKMVVRPVAGVLHIIVYLGFILINIELLEIVIDGIFGTHRFFKPFFGVAYDVAINFFEILALGVLLACILFLWRRNIAGINRFKGVEMKKWPITDANTILVVEIVLMSAFLLLNATENNMASIDPQTYSGPYVISAWMAPLFSGLSLESLHVLERVFWWLDILGILAFLNYVPYSKHFHIIMAFPNTWYASLKPAAAMNNMESVTQEVKMMMDPSFTPSGDVPAEPQRFGAKDVQDLSWKSLMDAYSCTECGRCTSVCPANITGTLLSPRKIMMDTRDRLEEVGKHLNGKNGQENDGKSLLGDYISHEEIWACTTCNACVDACPVNINPVNIIVELRRYSMLEESKVPSEWASMFGNIENNGAPWAFSAADRGKWAE